MYKTLKMPAHWCIYKLLLYIHFIKYLFYCDEWGGAESRGNGARPGPLSFHCCHSSFNPSEAPPQDSRPVSGAGVVHYQLLHRPRSVPTALGPAPLVTYPHRPSQAGGYSRDCALLPPSPLSRGEPVRAAAAYLGVRTDEAREKETEG